MASDERFEKLDQDLEHARALNREAIYRVSLLSASIVAFSATVLSIQQLDLAVNRDLLALSWCLFAAVIVVGPASIALEGRVRYVVTWRSFQPQHFDEERKLTLRERSQLLGVMLYTLILRPRSLFYARLSDYHATNPTQGMWMNFRMILALHFVWDIALALEVVIWLAFSSALIVLIAAFFP